MNPLDLIKSDLPNSGFHQEVDEGAIPTFAKAKAGGHKYISRKKVKGRWQYVYSKPKAAQRGHTDLPPGGKPGKPGKPSYIGPSSVGEDDSRMISATGDSAGHGETTPNPARMARAKQAVAAHIADIQGRSDHTPPETIIASKDMNNSWADVAAEVMGPGWEPGHGRVRELAGGVRQAVIRGLGLSGVKDRREAGDKPFKGWGKITG